MKNIKDYILESNNELIKIGFQNKIIDILKNNGYTESSSKDKIESINSYEQLYYFKDFDEIYLSYYKPVQIGKIIIFSNLECKLINIDKEANNEIDIISCDINDNYNKNKFLHDLNSYLAASKKVGTTNKYSN